MKKKKTRKSLALDIYNLDISLAGVIYRALKRFKRQTLKYGCYPAKYSFEEWIQRLDKMIEFFQEYVKTDGEIKLGEGFRYFCKDFRELWI